MKRVKIDKETEKKIEEGLKEIEEGKCVSFKELKKTLKEQYKRQAKKDKKTCKEWDITLLDGLE